MIFFWHWGTRPKVTSGLGCALAAGPNGWQNGFCGYPGVMLALVSSRAAVEGHDGRVDGFEKICSWGVGDRYAVPQQGSRSSG